jgi:arsenate reductase
MAEGFLKSFNAGLTVFSAGTKPAFQVHPRAVEVMQEIGINISDNRPKNADQFLNESFDFVITVCDKAKETCPLFTGKVSERLHIGFQDPADAAGTSEEILSEFRVVRDEIKKGMLEFYMNKIERHGNAS